MPRANRSARMILALALVAAGLLATGTVAPREALAKNLVDVNNRTKVITITVQADLVGGDDGYAEYLQQSFKDHWGKEFEYRCYTVKITLDIKVFPAGELPADDAPRHRIVLDQIDPGDPYRASAQWPSNYRPSDHSGEVHLSNYSFPGTIAHELGHILGLSDEYTYVDTDGNGRPSVGEPSIPDTSFPDVEWSLMADSQSGSVLQRHIDTIAGKHAPRGSIECKWQGSLEYRSLDSHTQGQNTASYLAAFTIQEDDDGVLEGTGSMTIVSEGSGTLDCGAYSHGMEPLTVDIAVSGQRTDETMTVGFTPLGDTQVVKTYDSCGAPDTYLAEAWFNFDGLMWAPPAPLTLVDNAFVFDDYLLHTYPLGQTEYWTVILVEPADDEGVPAG